MLDRVIHGVLSDRLLITSTVLTLLVLPAIFRWFSDVLGGET